VFMALYFNSNIPTFRKLASWNAEKRAHHRHCRRTRTLVDVGVRTFNLFLTGIRAAKAQKGTRGPRWFKLHPRESRSCCQAGEASCRREILIHSRGGSRQWLSGDTAIQNRSPFLFHGHYFSHPNERFLSGSVASGSCGSGCHRWVI
jgi:hypothetical protein